MLAMEAMEYANRNGQYLLCVRKGAQATGEKIWCGGEYLCEAKDGRRIYYFPPRNVFGKATEEDQLGVYVNEDVIPRNEIFIVNYDTDRERLRKLG